MPSLPSLPEPAKITDLARLMGPAGPAMMRLVEQVMRGPGEIDPAERELIAAYISGLNACTFCVGIHSVIAEAFGVEPGVIEACVADPATAPVRAEMRPILLYLAKLNQLPARLSQADMDAVFDAGWSEQAVYDAIQIAAVFAMMNRIAEGTGVGFDFRQAPESHSVNAPGADPRRHSYLPPGTTP